MVDHRDDRHARRADAEQAPDEALVVEHDVEAVASLELAPAQRAGAAPKVCISGNTPMRDTPSSQSESGCEQRERVAAASPSRRSGTPNTFSFGISWSGMPGVELGQRRPRDHVDVVAGALPLAREVGGVDALPAAEHVAAIGEQRDAHGAGAGSAAARRRRRRRSARRPGRARARPGSSRSCSPPRRTRPSTNDDAAPPTGIASAQ